MMNRRTFVQTALATGAALGVPSIALAAKPVSYTPGLVDDLLADGHTVFVDFKASWCTTCRAQERVINALLDQNPDYGKSIKFVNVDWDDYAKDPLTKRLKIPRRSTLVVLKGDKELGRVVAQTSKTAIKSLMDTALSSASA